MGVYRNQADALVATNLHSRKRMDEMEGLWAPAEGYYAVNIDDANEGIREDSASASRQQGVGHLKALQPTGQTLRVSPPGELGR